MLRSAVLLLLLARPGPVFAHGGGLDADGCHTNRKTGDYHCHRGGKSRRAAPAAPLMLIDAPSGGAYRNCTAARRAGAAPVRRGEPGYGPHLDRDNDGVGCE
ncbi:excalibur calcium-binding domain-containing protein [Paracoccus sanguinis]|uniref:excalibur calcium-binding domain-containing protein n=1 Tax=Paracoccus sanguinis TaxID=1545044 RepID=UPI0006911F42|nr:excalibur calcium-binding domain-containing protein [Paracoccus sanguinis]